MDPQSSPDSEDVAPAATTDSDALPAPELPPRAVIEVEGLCKRYGRTEALAGVDLTVREGEVFGFLGRNGAGKSTTIRILMGITRPTDGRIRILGEDIGSGSVRHRERIGYVAQEQHFYGWMTPRSLAAFVRGFYPTWDDAEFRRLATGLALPERKIQTFSGGMKVKLALAIALAHRPRLLVLDEPTAGLDPIARREFLELVREQATREGRTTFFSTHLIEEIELAAHRVGIVDAGRTRYEGEVKALLSGVKMLRRADSAVETALLPLLLKSGELPFDVLQDRMIDGERQLIVQAKGSARFEELLTLDRGWGLAPLGLEEIFIAMVRKPLRRP
ncbi:MAG: ABC transporter ATP-binding protein [Myxococcales bacterium]|jgi:ABC-2 type transport system ATP-binding protein